MIITEQKCRLAVKIFKSKIFLFENGTFLSYQPILIIHLFMCLYCVIL